MSATAVDRTDALSRPTVLLLTACAGATNLLSLTRLGGALSGILTGDLVGTGNALADVRWGVAVYPAVAVAAFVAGVVSWGLVVRRSRSEPAAVGGFVVESSLLLVVFAGLVASSGRPAAALSGALLAFASAAMGVQSAVCRRVGALSTTYMTGAVTGAVLRAVTRTGRDPVGTIAAQVLVLFAGAGGTALVLRIAAPVAAALPVLLAVCALGWHRREARDRSQAAGDAQGA